MVRKPRRHVMISSKTLVVMASVTMLTAAPAQSFHPSAIGKETTTRPWTAPLGHRQPHLSDIPMPIPGSQDFLDQEDAIVDRKIGGICRGC